MASILTEICQVSTLLCAADKSSFRSLSKTLTTKLLSLLLVSFLEIKLSNIAESSKSNLFLVALADLNILIEIFNSSALLSLELSVFLFSFPTYTSFLSSKSFFSFLFICQLAGKSSVLASLIFAFFLSDLVYDSVLDQTLAFFLVSFLIFRYPRLWLYYTPIFFASFAFSSY